MRGVRDWKDPLDVWKMDSDIFYSGFPPFIGMSTKALQCYDLGVQISGVWGKIPTCRKMAVAVCDIVGLTVKILNMAEEETV